VLLNGAGKRRWWESGLLHPGLTVILNINGVFAEYVAIPVRNLHQIPDTLSDEEAVFVEPLAAAFEILRQVKILPRYKVCVLGDGKLGILAGQVLSLTGCQLTVVGNHRQKLRILKHKGIRTRLRSEFREKGFDIAVDCTGSPAGIRDALNLVKPRGTIVLKTTVSKKREVDLNSIVVNELTLIGSRCGPFPQAIEALRKGTIDVRPLISMVFPLQDGTKAFRYAQKKGVLKVLFMIS
jgi:threonine dehydrogenase-like Zn-dependent dehydrogenase